MNMNMKAAVAGLALVASSAFAQYPNKPITTVVGFAPGGGTDTVSRIIAKTLGDQLGQQVLTDNRAGAGGNIATDFVVRAPADGYTLYLANVGAIAVNPHLLPLQYDPLTDLAPITMAVVFPNLVVVQPSVPANTLAEFIKLAKDNPGKYTYGSSGIGGAGHLAGELLKMMAKVDLVHVPFKGGGPAMQAMLGGQIDSYFATPVAAGPHVKAGKVKALATTGPKRDPFMADVPDGGRGRLPGLPGDQLVRLLRAGEDAEGHPRAAQSRDRQGAELRRGQGASRQAGPGSRARHAGAARRVRQVRVRDLGQGRQAGRY